jgi:hypothetical protein
VRGSRVPAGLRAERQQGEAGGHGPLRGSRAGDRFALTVISLALDEVDATAVLTGATGDRAARRPGSDPNRGQALARGRWRES